MKTIAQCLEGVTAGGKLEVLIEPPEEPTFRYIVRACSTWPQLVGSLNELIHIYSKQWPQELEDRMRAVVAEALKD